VAPTLVYSGDPNSPEARHEQLKLRVKWALRELSANILRIVRGAGKPEALARDLLEAVKAMSEYREVMGQGVAPWDITAMLDPDDSDLELRPGRHPELSPEDRKARYEDGSAWLEEAMLTMRRGSLQIAASMLLGQNTQVRAGERELSRGAQEHHAALEQGEALRRKRWAEAHKKPKRATRPRKVKKSDESEKDP